MREDTDSERPEEQRPSLVLCTRGSRCGLPQMWEEPPAGSPGTGTGPGGGELRRGTGLRGGVQSGDRLRVKQTGPSPGSPTPCPWASGPIFLPISFLRGKWLNLRTQHPHATPQCCMRALWGPPSHLPAPCVGPQVAWEPEVGLLSGWAGARSLGAGLSSLRAAHALGPTYTQQGPGQSWLLKPPHPPPRCF